MEKQIDFAGQWADEYDETSRKIIPGYHLIYELTKHLLMDRLSEEAKILVVGAGTGKEIIDLSQDNQRWSFTGIDSAAQMLSIARKKLQAASLTGRVTLVEGYVDDVATKDFDAVTAILVMQFVPDDGGKRQFLKSIFDRLKPGGVMVLVDLEGEVGSDEYNALSGAWKHQQLSTRKADYRVAREFVIREREVHFIPRDRSLSLLREAGFHRTYKFYQAYLFGGYIAEKR